MSNPPDDGSATVEYSRDKWVMDRVPWALWFCVAGLFITLHVDSRGANGAAIAGVYLALLGLAFAGWAATTLIERSGYPFYVVLPIAFLIVLLVVVPIAIFGTVGGGGYAYGRVWWGRLVNPPLPVFGWMLIYLGCGWIAYVLLRHFYPGRPILLLSPTGISFNRPWLRDLLIPWPDVLAVGHLETPNAYGPPVTHPYAVVVHVTQDFYKDCIAPRRSSLAPPGSERMFWPKDAMMQVVLNNPELVVAPEDFRAPIAARWKAFRDRPRPAPRSSVASTSASSSGAGRSTARGGRPFDFWRRLSAWRRSCCMRVACGSVEFGPSWKVGSLGTVRR